RDARPFAAAHDLLPDAVPADLALRLLRLVSGHGGSLLSALSAGRLAGLAADTLALVLDALALVPFGRALLTNVRRHLAAQRAIDPRDDAPGRALGRERDALGRRELDRVRVPELQHELLAVHVGAVTRTHDFEHLLEAGRHARDHVRQVGAGGPVE